MSLNSFFRLHALLAALYSVGLLFFPQAVIDWFSKDALTQPGTEITRLFGTSLIFIALITWEASCLDDLKVKRAIARALWIYTSIGFLKLLYSQFTGGYWNPWGWLNIVSYLIFVVGYGYFLWKPKTGECA